MSFPVVFLLWLAVAIATGFRIRSNRKHYRLRRADRTFRAWVKAGGNWHEEEEPK